MTYFYTSWYEIITTKWKYEIVETASFGDYQGDEVYILKDSDRFGFVVIGYGSSSGNDILKGACEDGPDAVDSLAEAIEAGIKWFNTLDEMYTHIIKERYDANAWWAYDQEIYDWFILTLEEKVTVNA